jgi:glycosyltransferase involved in cell wall biosynthesis
MVRFTDDIPEQMMPSTWWLYHLSSGSPVGDVIAKRPEPKMIDYHNITPGSLFGNWVPWATEEAETGFAQLKMLTAASTFCFADSAFNAEDLSAAGVPDRRTLVVPPLFDPLTLRKRADPELMKQRRAERAKGGADWLFVGRVTPSKAQHDLIKALAFYRNTYDPDARLHLVGTSMGDEYPRALERFARRIGIGEAVRLTGSVSDEELAAYYATSDVFVCASEHEGFCIPILEAMNFGLPVVAYAAGAVPETAGTGALVVDDKSPFSLATSVNVVLEDAALRERLVQMGHVRATEMSLTKGRRRWEQALEVAIDGTSRAGESANS